MKRPDLKGLTLHELEEFALSAGEAKYRGKQLFDWLYTKEAGSFDAMTTFSRALRARLAASASIGSIGAVAAHASPHDGTVKYLFALADGRRIESVLIPPRTAF